MRRPLRHALRSLRWLVGAVCLVALVGSLALWPRSYLYEDAILAFPPNVAVGTNPQLNIGGVNSRMGRFGVGWRPGLPARVAFWSREHDRGRRYEMLNPAVRFPFSFSATGNLRHAACEIWLVAAGASVLWYLAATRRTLRDLARFRVSHLLWGAVVVAAMAIANRYNATPTYAMLVEWGLLSVACVASARRASRQNGNQRRIWTAATFTLLASVIALALFYRHCVETVEPLALARPKAGSQLEQGRESIQQATRRPKTACRRIPSWLLTPPCASLAATTAASHIRP
ncbi:MAG: hypothetical protein AAF961_12450 [Planctomycetota bacterium]